MKGSAAASSGSFSWNSTSTPNGTHTITAKAYDAAGNVGTSSAISVSVNNPVPDTTAPSASVLAPAAGSSVSGTSTVTLSASDNVGVTKVEWYLDGALKGSNAGAVGNFSWSTTNSPNGSHAISAKAYDAAGNIGSSASVSVTVSNPVPDTTAPVATVTAPANNSSVAGLTAVTVTATDNVAVTKVEWYLDGALKGSTASASGTYSWDTTTAPNGSHTVLAKAYDSAGNVGTSASVTVNVSNPVPDTTAPVANVAAPANNSTVAGTSTVSVSATDNVGVTKVEWYLDGALKGSSAAATGSFSWDTKAVANGSHSVTARAYDAAGNIGTSPAVTVNVNNDTTAPTVSVTAPASNSTVAGTSTVTVTATDNVGVTKIEWYLDGALKASSATAGNFSWDTTVLANGAHTLTAKAYDAAGNVGTSAGVTVNVNNPVPDTTAPVAAVTAPANSSSVTGSVTVAVSGSDNIGVTKVEWYLDGALKGSSAAPTGNFPWDTKTVGNGSHSLTAKAYDAAGNIGASSAVTVTVNNDLTPPSVSLAAPANNTSLSGSITVTVSATDNVGVTKVEWYLDGALKGTSAAPGNFSWDTTTSASGSHTLIAKAYDAAGNVGSSAPVIVTVNNDTTAPVVSVTGPGNGSTISGSVTVSVGATDNVGLTKVEWYLDGALKGSSAITGNFSWDTTTVANGSHTLTAKAYDAAGNVGSSAPITVTVNNDTTAPVVSMTAPANNSTVSGNTTITVAATDNVGVTKIEWYLDGSLKASSTTAGTFAWDTTTAANGSHTLTAKAYDAAGNAGSSAVITVTVNNDTTAPVLSITAPANNSAVSGNTTITVAATDNVGVTKIEWYLDGALKASSTTTGTFPWDTTTVANGSHTLTAKAYDAAGNVGSSAAITVTVNNDTTAPVVSITAPANNSTVLGSTTVTVSATDNVGVTKVEWYLDGALKASSAAAGDFSWDTTAVANGSHTLSARAYDAVGNVGTSTTLSVTVSNPAPDTTAPAVSLTNPADGSTLANSVTVNVSATDNVGVTRVEWYLDGALQASSAGAAGSFAWDTKTVANGAHSLSSKAYDAAGNVASSVPVNITVSNPVPDLTAPSVAIVSLAPAGASTVSGTVTVDVSASDNVGISSVEWYLDGLLQGTSIDPNATFSWDTTTVANGPHTLSAKAYDPAGNVGSSAAVTVTVSNLVPDITAPVATISSPAGGSAVSGAVTVAFGATDNVGVSGMEFYIDGILAATVAGNTGTFPWDTASTPNGAHSLYVKAYDAAGNVGISPTVTVTVNNPVPDTTAPVVQITAPPNGSKAGKSVKIAVTATDNIAVTTIELDIDGKPYSTSTSSTATFNWNTAKVAAGNHTLQAFAFDAAGNKGASAIVTITK